MRKHTAEQVNKFLQGYHFDNEVNPRAEKTHFEVMKCGIFSVRTTLFCSKDTDADEDMKELNWMVKQLTDSVVPEPARITE
ncbi:hypothetical protein ABVL59_004809 [Salmonella enterica]|nr:hypothetical protein [Salmonella enterica]ECA7250769.1 hypothetical protein [Salmonella enterica subsp. enterica serovar Oranienburg]EDU5438959.1 hypothetical protein [Salmonella enterica subsp. enterica serovar Hadar]EEE1370007.1 hypothetical protein [Salmonella enterica subsp. enterica serovar Durban]EBA2275988.1 hypothetical protein [Salmonella enterica]